MYNRPELALELKCTARVINSYGKRNHKRLDKLCAPHFPIRKLKKEVNFVYTNNARKRSTVKGEWAFLRFMGGETRLPT